MRLQPTSTWRRLRTSTAESGLDALVQRDREPPTEGCGVALRLDMSFGREGRLAPPRRKRRTSGRKRNLSGDRMPCSVGVTPHPMGRYAGARLPTTRGGLSCSRAARSSPTCLAQQVRTPRRAATPLPQVDRVLCEPRRGFASGILRESAKSEGVSHRALSLSPILCGNACEIR